MHRTGLLVQYKYTTCFLAIASPDYSVENPAKLSHMRQFSRQLDDAWCPRDTLCYALHFHQTNFALLNPGIVGRRRIFGLRGEDTTVPHLLTVRPRSAMLSTGRLIPPRRGKLHFFAHGSLEPSPSILITDHQQEKRTKLHNQPPLVKSA